MPFNKFQFSPLEIITPQRSYHLPPMYAGRPEGKCDKHKIVMLNVGAVELSRTSEKENEFQLVLWASSPHVFLVWCHFLLVFVSDFVSGCLAWTLKAMKLFVLHVLTQQENLQVLALDYRTGLFLSIGLIKGTNLKLINLTKYEIVHPHFNLDHFFGSKPMFFTHLLQVWQCLSCQDQSRRHFKQMILTVKVLHCMMRPIFKA